MTVGAPYGPGTNDALASIADDAVTDEVVDGLRPAISSMRCRRLFGHLEKGPFDKIVITTT